MMINPISLNIRAKKLGVLIQDSRLASGKSLEECARAAGVSPAIFESYELGEASPSLPQLEVLAYFLNVPLDHFWEKTALSEAVSPLEKIDREQLASLRHRVIGTLVLQARTQAKLHLEDVASQVGISARDLEAYEFGEQPIPLPVLEAISLVLDRPIEAFQDRYGPVGAWMVEQRAAKNFLALSPELQAFVCKPVNRPYLELAQRLSEMSVEKLRAVAEGLLEITL
jgi:transcriptional regulator with XRE-family HTH domain